MLWKGLRIWNMTRWRAKLFSLFFVFGFTSGRSSGHSVAPCNVLRHVYATEGQLAQRAWRTIFLLLLQDVLTLKLIVSAPLCVALHSVFQIVLSMFLINFLAVSLVIRSVVHPCCLPIHKDFIYSSSERIQFACTYPVPIALTSRKSHQTPQHTFPQWRAPHRAIRVRR